MVVELDAWSTIGPEFGGRDERKAWVAPLPDSPRTDHWLWKPRRMTHDGTVPAINDVAEVIASRLSRAMDLPCAECLYAIKAEERGVISRNVTPSGYELHGGDVYLSSVEGYVRHPGLIDPATGRETGRMRRDEGYTLSAVEQVLTNVSGPPGWEQLNAYQVFAGYLVLDALIANGDRHPRNWALQESRVGDDVHIAPTFDHGSALGFGLTPEQRATIDLESWCAKGRAKPFSPKGQQLTDLAFEAIERSGAAFWLERVRALGMDQLRGIIEAPSEVLSEVSSNFILRVLSVNRRRLCDVDGDED